jgi:hypothetical protein
MGRPKGSKNKPKVTIGESVADTTVSTSSNKPKRTRKPKEAEPTDKAALKALMNAPISPAELKQLRAEAMENAAKVTDPQSVVNRAIEEVIKPNWMVTQQDGAGLKHFLVNAQRHGETVSMDKEKWDFGLKQAGIRGQLTASKPEAGQDLEAKTVNRWRVMIG